MGMLARWRHSSLIASTWPNYERGAPRLLGCHPGAEVVKNVELEVRLEFLRHVPLAPPERKSEANLPSQARSSLMTTVPARGTERGYRS